MWLKLHKVHRNERVFGTFPHLLGHAHTLRTCLQARHVYTMNEQLMSFYPLRSNEAGGITAGSDRVCKQTVLFLHGLFADVSLSMKKSSEAELITLQWAIILCLIHSGETFLMVLNTFRVVRTFLFLQRQLLRIASMGTNMNTKDATVFPNIIRVAGTYVYDGLSRFIEECGWEHLVIRVILIHKICVKLSILHELSFVLYRL